MDSKYLSWAKFLIGWPLSVISIIFIVKIIYDRASELNINLSEINIVYLILSLLFFFIYLIMRNLLWWQLLLELKEAVNFKESTYRFSVSELKRYIPGNIWSFLSRASLFEDAGISRKVIGVSIVADIQLVIIGCGILSMFAIPWILDSQGFKSILGGLIPGSIFAASVFFLGTGYIYRRKYSKESSLSSSLFLPGFGMSSKIKLTLLSVITYSWFGIWNYMIVKSLYPIISEDPFILITVSVFALLAGYLTFITPAGIGAREAVLTLGLSKIMSVADAGLVSIFSRVAFIVFELLFLLFVFLWRNLSKK